MIGLTRGGIKRAGIVGTIFQTGFTNLLVVLLTFVISTITARGLGVVGRGELTAVLFWSTLLSGLISFGLPTSLIYNLKKNMDHASDYVSVAMFFYLPVGLIAAVCAYFFIPFWMEEYSSTAVALAQAYIVICLPMLLLNSIVMALSKGTDHFQVYNALVLGIPLINLVGLTVLWSTGNLTLLTSTISSLVSVVVVFGTGISFVLRRSKLKLPNWRSGSVRPLWSYGIKVYAMEVVGTVYNNVDKLIIVSLLSPRELGLYAVVFALSRLFNTVQMAISDVIFPKVAGLDTRTIISTVGRAFRVSTLCMVALYVPAMLIGSSLLGIVFGKEFLEAERAFYLLSLECIIGGSSWILASSFNAIGRPGLVLVRQLVAISTNIVLFFVFVPRYGLDGIAYALCVGGLIRLSITLLQIPSVFKVSLREVVYSKEDWGVIKDLVVKKTKRRKVAS